MDSYVMNFLNTEIFCTLVDVKEKPEALRLDIILKDHTALSLKIWNEKRSLVKNLRIS